MSVTSRVGHRTKGLIGRLARAREGGVAMMFALALPPICMMGVCGVDIHRASTVRAQLQDALDAAALSAARSNETTDAGIRAVGMRALRANLAAFPDVTLREAASYTDFDLNADGSVVAKAEVDVEALVADMFLGDMMTVGVDSTVFRSNYRVEVALVIDNTGSMGSGGKLEAAQEAAANLVERLAEAAERSVEEEAVRISLVPFSMTVRVHEGFASRSNRSGASALGWLSRSTSHTGSTGETGLFSTGVDRFAILDTLRIGWGGCIESRPYPYDVQDTAPTSGNQSTMFVPYFSPDSPDEDDIPGDNTWQRYSYDNDYLNDWQSAVSSSWRFDNNAHRLETWSERLRHSSKYARNRLRSGIGTNLGPNQGCGLEPVVRLTEDYDQVLESIWDMRATGNTNVPMGLMWGWHTLSPRAPFADGRPYGEERLQKIVIAPPSAIADRWSRRFADPVAAFASGWMSVRARARQRGVELPLVISDHADWDELTATIAEVAREEVWITHGREEGLMRWAELRGLRSRALALVGYEDDEDDG